jgi:hypothetical protein
MEFNTDPDRPIEKILADIKQGALNTVNSREGLNFVGALLAPFAALLVRLLRDAEKSAKRIEYLTWVICGLTVALFVLTAYLVYDAYESHYLKINH